MSRFAAVGVVLAEVSTAEFGRIAETFGDSAVIDQSAAAFAVLLPAGRAVQKLLAVVGAGVVFFFAVVMEIVQQFESVFSDAALPSRFPGA